MKAVSEVVGPLIYKAELDAQPEPARFNGVAKSHLTRARDQFMGRYSPIARDHAVDEAVVGVRLFEAVDEETYQAAIKVGSDLAKEVNLPGRVQLDPMSLLVGRQVVSAGYTDMAMYPGILFQRVNADGSMAEELTIERSAVTYRTRSYQRWADVQGYIGNILIPIVEILTKNDPAEISVVELRCVDKFIASQDEFPALGELIRSDCELIPAHMLDLHQYMHFHSGWFEEADDKGRTLINVNIDVNDDRTGGIVTSILQVFSKQSATKGGIFEGPRSIEEIVKSHFDELHAQDKRMLARLLTDEIQDSINLVGSSGLGQA